ncbi:nitroreductase family protein [Streptomyces sp. HC307]|uniref:nitroreductase family protein n=1 Tax=Streptomyces flavusporus TaxID=3385496 RepID=UPI0039171875
MTAILTRRSRQTLSGPAPSDEEFCYLLSGAAAAPDHGGLRPWRWILLRDRDRETLGACLAGEVVPERQEQVARKLLRAPLVAVLVFSPNVDHKVPEWEQLAAASSMMYAMQLLLHARDYGSIWRSGRLCESTAARELLGLAHTERLLGSLDIGTPDQSERLTRRARADVSDWVSTFSAAAAAVY